MTARIRCCIDNLFEIPFPHAWCICSFSASVLQQEQNLLCRQVRWQFPVSSFSLSELQTVEKLADISFLHDSVFEHYWRGADNTQVAARRKSDRWEAALFIFLLALLFAHTSRRWVEHLQSPPLHTHWVTQTHSHTLAHTDCLESAVCHCSIISFSVFLCYWCILNIY